jgi:hypothetical protein
MHDIHQQEMSMGILRTAVIAGAGYYLYKKFSEQKSLDAIAEEDDPQVDAFPAADDSVLEPAVTASEATAFPRAVQ